MDENERPRWFALVRVKELKSNCGLMEVVGSYPTHGEAIRAFLKEPDKHALAVFPSPFLVKLDDGSVHSFEPGKHRGGNWVEDMDRALDQVLGRPCFTKRFAELTKEPGRNEPAKVIDFDAYRRSASFNPDI